MAGIKVNTDFTPKYRLHGADGGKWDGKRCIKFYLEYTGDTSGGWGASASSAAGRSGYMILYSKNVVDFGYGSGVFVSGCSKDIGVIGNSGCTEALDREFVGYHGSHDIVASQWEKGNFYGNYAPYLKYATSHGGATDITSFAWPFGFQTLYQKGLSDAFQQCITLYCPIFTLVEFLDSGEANLNIAVVANGGQYDGGKHGGSTSEDFSLSQAGYSVFGINHNGVFTELCDTKSVNGLNWVVKPNVSVTAGDTFELRVLNGSGGNQGNYGIIFIAKDIPGWKEATA